MKYGQTMISSETRRLLVTIAVSIGLLWVLARIRFQERTAPPTAVAPVLAQLRPSASYDDLARAVADVRPIVSAAVVATGAGSAFRISGDHAVTLHPDGGMPVIATDRATQLAVIGVPRAELAGVIPWMPRVLDYPRFFLVAERAGDRSPSVRSSPARSRRSSVRTGTARSGTYRRVLICHPADSCSQPKARSPA